jgi:hypothetical protein
MKRLCLLAAFTLSVSCGGLGRGEVVAWMDAKTEAPTANFAGSWESLNSYMNGGWGSGTWVQTGARVTGNLGLFGIDGKVAGKKLYIMILNGSKPAYTAILELKEDGKLEGLAFPKVLADSPEARTAQPAPVVLVKARS